MPGSKAMLPNREAVDKILAVALMLDCTPNERLIFQRKHYSWPDLPNGYQKTMSGSYAVPVGENGSFLGIGIEEVHLEEDPARWDPETGNVDYNRSGYPLVEIVTKPDFTSAGQLRDWLKKLVTLLSYVNAVDPNMGIKADVNVSIGPKFKRVEVKNVNSFKSIVKAFEHEILRQAADEKEGVKFEQHTRAWDESTNSTKFMRSKEQAMDYMFIPEPDLPAVHVDKKKITNMEKDLPEKPAQKVSRYTKKMKLDKIDAEVLSAEIQLAELFEKVAEEIDPILAARWLRRELLRVLNYNKQELADLKADEKHIKQLLKLVEKKEITDKTAQKLIEKLVEEPFDVAKYVKEHKLGAVSDENVIEQYVKEAIDENPKAVEDFKAGKQEALNFIVGQVMRKSKGKATPDAVQKLVKKNI